MLSFRSTYPRPWDAVAETPVGAIIGRATSWFLRIREMNIAPGCHCRPDTIGPSRSSIPDKRLAVRIRTPARLSDQRRVHARRLERAAFLRIMKHDDRSIIVARLLSSAPQLESLLAAPTQRPNQGDDC